MLKLLDYWDTLKAQAHLRSVHEALCSVGVDTNGLYSRISGSFIIYRFSEIETELALHY
jgi:hypothetical protein